MGGLGIKEMGTVFIHPESWRFLSEKSKLWANMLYRKYLIKDSFWMVKKQSYNAQIRKGMLKGV